MKLVTVICCFFALVAADVSHLFGNHDHDHHHHNHDHQHLEHEQEHDHHENENEYEEHSGYHYERPSIPFEFPKPTYLPPPSSLKSTYLPPQPTYLPPPPSLKPTYLPPQPTYLPPTQHSNPTYLPPTPPTTTYRPRPSSVKPELPKISYLPPSVRPTSAYLPPKPITAPLPLPPLVVPITDYLPPATRTEFKIPIPSYAAPLEPGDNYLPPLSSAHFNAEPVVNSKYLPPVSEEELEHHEDGYHYDVPSQPFYF